MPIYAYTCKSCEKSFEKLVKRMRSDDDAAPAVACPECGSTDTARQLTAPAALTSVGADPTPMPGCGRCGGPGPCPSGF